MVMLRFHKACKKGTTRWCLGVLFSKARLDLIQAMLYYLN